MEIKGEKALKIEDGLHKGKIVSIEYRDDPYSYTDIHIEEAKTRVLLRCGVPTKISEYSGLGKILMNFGIEIKEGAKYDPEKILVGKLVSFVTVTKETDKGAFANIQALSIKPVKE